MEKVIHPPIAIGSTHYWIINGAFWGILLAYLIVSKHVGETTRKNMGKFLGFAAFANFIISQITLIVTNNWDVQVDLPLQLCSISTLLSGFVLLRGSQLSYEFLIYWGAGAVHSFLTPELDADSSIWHQLDYIIIHTTIILGSVYATMRMGYKPRQGSWWKVGLWTQLALPIIGGINYLLGTNYMYLCQRPEANNPLVIGPWPYYLIGLEIAILAHFCLFYYLHRALHNWSSTNKVSTESAD